MNKKEIISNMTESLDQIRDFVDQYDYKVDDKDWGIGVFVNGIKLEWNLKGQHIKLGFGNDKESDLPMIYEWLKSEGYEVGLTRKGGLSTVYPNPTVDQFKEIFELVESHDLDLKNPQGIPSNKSQRGVSFEGSNFSNGHERLTSIGPRFMSGVCKASGMELERMDAEWKTMDGGRIDGAEINEDGSVKSIYECQSGIQDGAFLDNEHLSKALLRYVFDPSVIEKLERIVILAGGYTQDSLNIIKGQADMLSKRDQPIEVILLQTTRINNKIGVERVNF